MKPLKTTGVYPITLGRKGIDNFLFKYADGTVQPFLTEEEIKEWDILFPKRSDDNKTIKVDKIID